MTPRQLLRSIPAEVTQILGSDEYAGEAYLVDSDGRNWHVAVKALPRHVEILDKPTRV